MIQSMFITAYIYYIFGEFRPEIGKQIHPPSPLRPLKNLGIVPAVNHKAQIWNISSK